MSESTPAQHRQAAGWYDTSRDLWDVLLGDDLALSLINASSSGNIEALRQVLSQPNAGKQALEEQLVIYNDNHPDHTKDEERQVLAMPMSNIQRAITKAAYNGHAAAIPVLAKFAKSKCGMKRAPFLDRAILVPSIRKGDVAVLEALGTAWPASLRIEMERWGNPLDVALNFQNGRSLTKKPYRYTYKNSLLSLSARAEGTRMAELLIEQKFAVNGSGALHYAAELGRLDVIRVLLEHGADVNELLTEAGLIMVKDESKSLYASWTPTHFAAYGREVEAMELLEKHGARLDVKDKNGKTPAQLLDEQMEADDG
nr:hypothetical protein B0A51_16030 [Rachicladosporium sp. CCFEE 5018]